MAIPLTRSVSLARDASPSFSHGGFFTGSSKLLKGPQQVLLRTNSLSRKSTSLVSHSTLVAARSSSERPDRASFVPAEPLPCVLVVSFVPDNGWLDTRKGSRSVRANARAAGGDVAENENDGAGNVAVSDSKSLNGALALVEAVSRSDVSTSDAEAARDSLVSADVAAEVNERLQRLEVLMLLRRLYRDANRSERVLNMPIPVIAKKREGTQELKARRKVRRGANYWIRRGLGVAERKGEGEDKPILVVESALEVLGCAADVRALAGSLTRDLNFFHGQLPAVFPEETKAAEGVADVVRTLAQRLEELADRIEASLSAEQRREVEEELEAQALQEQMDKEANVQERVLRRLGGLSNTSAILDRVRQRIASVDISFGDLSIDLPTIKGAGGKVVRTLVDTWRRLNGRPPTTELEPLASGLPRPDSTGDKEEEKKLKLLLEVEALDKRLNEAIRSREQRLRQRNVLVRARLAREIKALDDEVNELRKELAVRTLQLQMQVIYMFLEQELLFAADSQDVRSDEDESLLVAEYGLLDADLARLRTAVDRNEAILIEDEELEALAIDIPDLKFRLGIMEEPSVPLQQRAQMTVEEAKGKVGEGASFFARGVRLLAGDVAYSARLFWVAATGTTLKAREVQTLRRTATDLLVVIPFAIILIAPITPVGHVAVFGFLQRYFPGFFPSAFSSRRQEVMVRYENLKLQMATASGSEKEKVQAMAAAAATETFEASEEDSAGGGGMGMHGGVGGGSGGGGMGMGMGGFAFGLGFGRGENVGGQSSRIWRDERAKLLLLQEKLPGISRLVSSLREADGRRDGEAGEKAEGGLASSLQALASPLLSSSAVTPSPPPPSSPTSASSSEAGVTAAAAAASAVADITAPAAAAAESAAALESPLKQEEPSTSELPQEKIR
ncbi:unnamed protein product [Closterium sp. NIES-53]